MPKMSVIYLVHLNYPKCLKNFETLKASKHPWPGEWFFFSCLYPTCIHRGLKITTARLHTLSKVHVYRNVTWAFTHNISATTRLLLLWHNIEPAKVQWLNSQKLCQNAGGVRRSLWLEGCRFKSPNWWGKTHLLPTITLSEGVISQPECPKWKR